VQDPALDYARAARAWIGMEAGASCSIFQSRFGDFMAFVPGSRKQQTFPRRFHYVPG